MKTSKFTDSQIMSILKQAESGTPVATLCREHGMSNATFYKWRARYSGMDTSLMARLKELEAENTRLKKMYAEERLKAEIVQEAMSKKWWKCAGIRAIKTVAQTMVASIGTAVVLSDVNWVAVLSASILAGGLSLLTSIAGLPEVEKDV